MILNSYIYYGLAILLITLLIIIIKIISNKLELEMKIVLQSLILLILLQVINLSIPRIFHTAFQQYLLTYGLMILPAYLIIKNTEINYKKKQIYYIFLSLLIGTITTLFEYRMLTGEIISINGEIVIIFIMTLLSMSFILLDTKYWNNILDVCSYSLMPLFILIAISKIIVILKI